MQVLYEEAGDLKVASVMTRAPASLHIETPHGRRAKIRTVQVLFEFESPAGPELLAQAQAFAAAVDADFLWQCCGQGEFDFRSLAREYVGHEPLPVESVGVLVRLHQAPMYFYRRGPGRFQAAPAETLKLALAAVEKKRRIQEQIASWSERLARFDCPEEISAARDELLYAPDRNAPQWKALDQACRQTGLAPVRLFERCGLLSDTHAYHFKRFLIEFFPGGVAFPAYELPAEDGSLPRADVEAFSLDDVGTTEIDDAFSLVRLPDGTLRVGVHIAAPAIGIVPGSALDRIARQRLSTAYMPGQKITMLPEDAVARYSLDCGSVRPAASLYLDVSPGDYRVLRTESRAERISIVANLRHAECAALNDAFPAGTRAGLPREDELRELWKFANALEARRGKPSAVPGIPEYTFAVEGDRVTVMARKRGAPLDKLVSELMIAANTTWGGLLAGQNAAAIYRVQTTGKVRLSVHPEPHEGLGVTAYAWMTSPLRRYVDLLNQRQLLAVLAGQAAPLGRSSDALHSALRAFELTYARYDEYQQVMESYWSLRWLQQEGKSRIEAVVLREGAVRLVGLPLVVRVPSLPPSLAPDTRVVLGVGEIDLLERTVACTYLETHTAA